jgi:hypothetical protein
MTTTVDDLLAEWAESERNADADRLDRVLADDFAGIGPAGFVLDKPAWLGRFARGLRYERLALDEITEHRHGGTTFVVARQHANGDAGGQPTFEDLRVSFTVVPDRGDVRIAGIQYSFMGIPGAPR